MGRSRGLSTRAWQEPLPIQLESHGTRVFVGIFPLIIQALQSGGVAVIDELDLATHPIVLPEIVAFSAARNSTKVAKSGLVLTHSFAHPFSVHTTGPS
jgi:hypothetical protein